MKLKIFFSWQSPTKAQGFDNKKLLIECIGKAANEIKGKGRLKGVDFELHEGMSRVAGAAKVADKMFEQIRDCDIFIADFTIQSPQLSQPVAEAVKVETGALPRREPNANVLMEFVTALAKAPEFDEQCILLINTVNGDPDKNPDLIPFDIRERRHPIPFYMDKDTDVNSIKEKLVNSIKDALHQTAVSALVHKREKYLPFISWEELSANKNLAYPYVETDDLQQLKQRLVNNKGIVRLIGLSGMGKTRLVKEAFNDEEHNLNFLYANCNDFKKEAIYNRLDFLFHEYKQAIIVVDNCDKGFLFRIMELRDSSNAINPIITIYNDPNERRVSGTDLIVLERDRNDAVVLGILSKNPVLTEEQRAKIADFASGNPKMAELLVRGLNSGRALGDLDDSELMTKLLQTDEQSDARVILQSLSLFQYVGYREDKRSQVESIAKSKPFTLLNYNDDTIMYHVDEVINTYKRRGILESRGRYIGIRPLPLAFHLIEEWLDKRSEETMLAAIHDLTAMKDSQELTKAFHNQFRNMGFYDKAQFMLDQLLAHPSPFESAEVINTEVGSQLFRTFVEVNPVAVATLLYNVLSPLSVKELKKIVEGRRSLVWTVEKLCFDSRTFWQGAYLMMRLGVAENEAWSNNASSDFASLFPIILPSTSADLNTRLTFLRENINSKEDKPLIFRALRSALQVRGFIYMSGAEEQGTKKLENYKPKSFDEIRTYFSGCLEMVSGEISNHGECRDVALDILEKVTPNLCRAGYADIVLPVVYKVAELLGWNWDDMQGGLLMFRESIINSLADTDKNLYMELLERLTKHDIVSEFRAVQKEGYASSHGKDFHEREKENQRKYAKLAEAFASAYSKIDLEGLMVSENLLIHPFGSRLYELMDDDEKKTFVADSVNILNGNPQAKTAILLDFFGAGKEADVDVYAPSLQKLDNKGILFEIYGRLNVSTGSPYFGGLTGMIKCGKVPVKAFNRYWINLPLATQTLEQKTAFFKVVLSFPGGLPVVMRMAAFMTMDKTIKPVNNLISLLVSAIEQYHSDTTPVLQVDGVPMIATNILSNYKLADFAAFIHHELIVYLSKTDNVIVNNYDISQLYEVLINKYFGVIWPELSASIVSDDILQFLHVSEVVGTMMSNDEPGLLFKSDHLPEFMKLCEDYPAVAPARIIHMAPPYGPEGLSDLVMAILDNYGDQDGVLDELGAKLGSFSSSGSVIPNLEQQKDALVPLQYSENDKVASWAKRELLSLDIQIKKWRTIEEEPLM